jgi:hypothetical protein
MLVAKERMCCEHPPAERCAQDASFRLENSLVFGKKVHHEIPGVQYRFGENRAKFAG